MVQVIQTSLGLLDSKRRSSDLACRKRRLGWTVSRTVGNAEEPNFASLSIPCWCPCAAARCKGLRPRSSCDGDPRLVVFGIETRDRERKAWKRHFFVLIRGSEWLSLGANGPKTPEACAHTYGWAASACQTSGMQELLLVGTHEHGSHPLCSSSGSTCRSTDSSRNSWSVK